MKGYKKVIKLIAVDSNHFIRYKCKILHKLSNIVWQYSAVASGKPGGALAPQKNFAK